MKRKRDEAFGFLIHLSVDLPLSFPPPCFPFALSPDVPDTSLGWRSYRASEAAARRETMKP